MQCNKTDFAAVKMFCFVWLYKYCFGKDHVQTNKNINFKQKKVCVLPEWYIPNLHLTVVKLKQLVDSWRNIPPQQF